MSASGRCVARRTSATRAGSTAAAVRWAVSCIRSVNGDTPSSSTSGTAASAERRAEQRRTLTPPPPVFLSGVLPFCRRGQHRPTRVRTELQAIGKHRDALWPCGPRAARESSEGSAPSGPSSQTTYGRHEHAEGREEGEQLENAVHPVERWLASDAGAGDAERREQPE